MDLEETIHRLEVVHRLDVLLEVARDETDGLSFDRGNQQHVCAVALNGTIQELAASCLTLFKTNHGNCIPILLRALLEAYVDLKNLVDNPSYTKHMEASWLNENYKLVKTAKELGSSNPYLARAAKNPKIDKDAEERKKRIDGLKKEGYPPLSIAKRFELAGETDRYQGVYTHLCMHAHNNLNALETRHLAATVRGPELVYFRCLSDEETAKYFGELSQLSTHSVELAKRVVEGQPAQLENLSRALASVRSLWSAD